MLREVDLICLECTHLCEYALLRKLWYFCDFDAVVKLEGWCALCLLSLICVHYTIPVLAERQPIKRPCGSA